MNADKTIIYIEDNPTNLKLVEKLIQRKKEFRLLSSTKSKEGLALINKILPDLILLDINLPEMDGYEILKILKSNTSTASIPVFAVSANAMMKDLEKGKQAGFTDYITKPIDVADFYNKLDQHLT